MPEPPEHLPPDLALIFKAKGTSLGAARFLLLACNAIGPTLAMARKKPNVIVTGTPGVGKTSHCEILSERTGLKHFSINQIVKERGCHEGWDEEYKSWIVNEDELLDSVEDEIKTGGYIIDWHACELFPKSWIDLVIVLRTDSTNLYDRLQNRHYPEKKVQENLDCEIMAVLLEEARGSYDEQIVIELQSNDVDDIEANVERIEEWIKSWREKNK